jgi:eukaryotic-like serine/threonine-protein kinase
MMVNSWEGKVLGGRYEIGELLGQGGMSSVYKANDPNLRRSVAIKMVHPHLSNNPEFVRRFEEEAASVARLRHPNIIQVYDFSHEDDLYYMVMEYLAGETLQARLKR